MDNDKKMIRFIDSNYTDLFFIPDGGNIVLTFSDGKKAVRACTFLDEYHVQIGKEPGRGEVLHICQFAEIMEKNGTAYAPEKPPELPEKCFSTLPSSGELILIERGKKGYTPCPWCTGAEQGRREATQRNQSFRVTRQQEAAMLGGSMFGWSTPAARTSSYDVKGQPITPGKAKKPKSKEQER